MLVCVIAKTKSHILQGTERLLVGAALLTERDIVATNELVEFDRVISRLAFTVSSKDEYGNLVFWKLV